jgi:hypothetical protein
VPIAARNALKFGRDIGVPDDNLPIAEQQPSGVRRYQAAIQSCFRRAAIAYSKIKAFRATTCRHWGSA